MRPPALVTRFLLSVAGAASVLLAPAGKGADEKTAHRLAPEVVERLEKSYQEERQAAEKSGLVKKFSPEWFERADAMAKAGSAALKAGRLFEARDSFRRARWGLPSLPLALPVDVTRVLGDGKLRHGGQ